VGAGGAAGADLDLGVDRDLPGRPGHLHVRQPGAGRDRQQRPGHGAAHDLGIDRTGGAVAVTVTFADPNDGITQGHAQAEAEGDAGEFGFADTDAGRVRGRARESVALSRRFGAALDGVSCATLGGVEHRVPAWC
jgi:hypothetical protein